MKTLRKFKLNQCGDTIVEVLIAISIVSLVLAGAYSSTKLSRNGIQTAQEHGEALKLAEAQVEQIKLANRNNVTLPASFCFVGSAPTALPDAACTTSTNVPYDQSITKTGTNNYVVVVEWDSLSGQRGRTELDYRAE